MGEEGMSEGNFLDEAIKELSKFIKRHNEEVTEVIRETEKSLEVKKMLLKSELKIFYFSLKSSY